MTQRFERHLDQPNNMTVTRLDPPRTHDQQPLSLRPPLRPPARPVQGSQNGRPRHPARAESQAIRPPHGRDTKSPSRCDTSGSTRRGAQPHAHLEPPQRCTHPRPARPARPTAATSSAAAASAQPPDCWHSSAHPEPRPASQVSICSSTPTQATQLLVPNSTQSTKHRCVGRSTWLCSRAYRPNVAHIHAHHSRRGRRPISITFNLCVCMRACA